MNKVILAGRLTKDIEMRYTQTGKAIARFILSVNRRVSKDKEKQQADFIPIIVWNKLAEVCSKYLTKGSQILVEGHLQIRDYVAQDGKKHYIADICQLVWLTDILFLLLSRPVLLLTVASKSACVGLSVSHGRECLLQPASG